MPVISDQFAEALVPGIERFFDVGFNMRPPMRQMLFNVQSSEQAWEEFVGMGGTNPEPFRQYSKNGTIGKLEFNKGYVTRFTHVEYPADFVVERSLIDDDAYGVIRNRAENLGSAAQVLMESDASSVFNNAFDATNFAGIDGQSLCDGAHPASPDDTGTTFSNSGTTALSKDAVKDTRVLMMAYTDDAGNKINIIPDTLIVPPALEDDALEITRSIQDPDTGNNAINPQAGRFRVIPWLYLSDSDNWFMADSVAMRQSLFWFDRVPFRIETEKMRMNQVEIVYPTYMRYSYGYTDWRWIYGHAT